MTVESPGIAVVGGGVAGLAMAFELAQRGQEVVVFAGPQPRASEVAAGMLAPAPEVATGSDLGALAAQALERYPGFLQRLATVTRRNTGFIRSGLLRLAYTDEEATWLRSSGTWLNPSECAALEPGVGLPDLRGGVVHDDQAHVQPAWLLGALTEAVTALGGSIEGRSVVRLRDRGPAVEVHLEGGTRRDFARAIVAAGAWSPTLGLGLPVRPVKGQLLVFRGVVGPARIIYRGHRYLVAKPDGTLLLGATVEEDGYSLDPSPAADGLRAFIAPAWPAVAAAFADVRVGLRPAAPDSLPVIGPMPGAPRVYVFSGHHRNGFLLGPETAARAAREIVEGSTDPALAPYRVERLEVIDLPSPPGSS